VNANAKKWVATLRSGRFRQEKGKLRTPYGYCCLGVACELFHKEYPDFERFYNRECRWYEYGGREDFLPLSVQQWLGLKDEKGTFARLNLTDSSHNLAVLNDGGETFEGIANFIELNEDRLFVEPPTEREVEEEDEEEEIDELVIAALV
jgi:hypothetical protein